MGTITHIYISGIIIQYRLYHNGLEVFTSPSISYHLIDGLQPWSVHKFRVAACTLKGCGSSNEVTTRTQEAPPVGEVGLEIGEITSRTVQVRYTAVAQPNGLIYYDVYFKGNFYANAGKSNVCDHNLILIL